ncbi:MAG: hypothetical protein K0R31_1148, partial [Clostridiales bacterium]|nr:hypothetical protein [Clostridiales bacterium]
MKSGKNIIILMLLFLMLPHQAFAVNSKETLETSQEQLIQENTDLKKMLCDNQLLKNRRSCYESHENFMDKRNKNSLFTNRQGGRDNFSTRLIPTQDTISIQKEIVATKTQSVNDVVYSPYHKKANNFESNEGVLQEAYRAEQLEFDILLSKKFTQGYSITKGSNTLIFQPLMTIDVEAVLQKSDTLLYENVWTDTDVTLQVTNEGIKEDIIIKSESAPKTFTYKVWGNISDDLTSGELSILPAWLMDANGQIRDVQQNIRREQGTIFMDIILENTEGLAYPIIIDPTIVAMGNDDIYYTSDYTYSLTDDGNLW